MSALDEVGAIAPGYEHVSKVVHPAPAVEARGGLLKWYDIAQAEQPIPASRGAGARGAGDRAGAARRASSAS